ncbi:MAG: nuclease-related domain-containing protein [Ilumatobacteraceae bacterium]|nr:nuclease-related domain-containing protein [Ilumatobacteraceae bacterium]
MAAGESAAEQARKKRERAARLQREAEKWERGAEGERRIAAVLDRLPTEYVVFHDLQLPNSKANVDHLVIGPTGIWAVDSKNYSNPVTIGSGKGAGMLWTGRRPLTKTIETSIWEASVVAELVGYPVDPLMCILAPSLPRNTFEWDGLRLCSPSHLRRELESGDGTIDVAAAASAVRHAFGVEPEDRTSAARSQHTLSPTAESAPEPKRATKLPPRRLPSGRVGSERRASVRRRTSQSQGGLLKLLLFALFLIFGAPLVLKVVNSLGQEGGRRLAESMIATPSSEPGSTTTAPTTTPATTTTTPIVIDPPPPFTYTVTCALSGRAWDVHVVWPGEPPDGVASIGVRTRFGDGPVRQHSTSAWSQPGHPPATVRLTPSNGEFTIIGVYRDERGRVLASTEQPFETPSLVC